MLGHESTIFTEKALSLFVPLVKEKIQKRRTESWASDALCCDRFCSGAHSNHVWVFHLAASKCRPPVHGWPRDAPNDDALWPVREKSEILASPLLWITLWAARRPFILIPGWVVRAATARINSIKEVIKDMIHTPQYACAKLIKYNLQWPGFKLQSAFLLWKFNFVIFCKVDERRSPALALASAKSASAPIFGAQSASASASAAFWRARALISARERSN